MLEAIQLATKNVQSGKGGPFGAVIVKDGVVIAKGVNQVTSSGDPTAHAEIVAIRNACASLNTFQLDGCEIYSSCEPCPMCLGAIYWARPSKLYFANTKKDAAGIGFDDAFIYEELELEIPKRKLTTIHLELPEAIEPFELWNRSISKVEY
ncbi:MAG: nucleoside deaminase [Saprospiraceae bacterium]|nr:nucleoside deaminase [Saprospiraceae bacterium]